MQPAKLNGLVLNRQYVEGLQEPLKAVIDMLYEQDKRNFAKSLEEISEVMFHYCLYVEPTDEELTGISSS